MIPQGIKATAGHEKKKERDIVRLTTHGVESIFPQLVCFSILIAR